MEKLRGIVDEMTNTVSLSKTNRFGEDLILSQPNEIFQSVPASDKKIMCFIPKVALNDIFFRILYFRYIMLGAFADVEMIQVVVAPVDGNSTQPKNLAEVLEGHITTALEDPKVRVLVMVLRNQGYSADDVLGVSLYFCFTEP